VGGDPPMRGGRRRLRRWISTGSSFLESLPISPLPPSVGRDRSRGADEAEGAAGRRVQGNWIAECQRFQEICSVSVLV
jgi:hypothetical protein